MITVLIGTNRPRSRAGHLARLYASILAELGTEHQLLDLAELPADFTTTALYHNVGKHDDFNRLATKLAASEKVVFIIPEYNASFPGVLKAFIDGLAYPGGLRHKKAALVGLSSGGQGGLLPMAHLTDVLMYLGTAVLPQRVRLPFADKSLTLEGELTDAFAVQLLREQAAALLAF
ncbi:NAD(P)H-dependent oxidoreductase [Hymenobacter sp. ASUV-10]|uniref:NAD(P)H-dependent oxidoreductase n=1 Tax=Hymenobacter aranciens TaxID=3063996 RepID=A0ABT9BJD6_9BACT|nr:NAD(P)H-dependent oxidoreductase [Hymenobacter sp. ASUV-10]MDO7876761.1 NAD(P)H-dependent oxidoreductase [Hymenobacter sp. ASUV-10]